MARRILLLALIVVAWAVWRAASLRAATPPPDLLAPRTVQICTDSSGAPAECIDGDIRGIDASVDGQVVSFDSNSNRLVPADSNRASDIFVWQEGRVQRASVGAAGEQGNDASDYAALSGNGRYVYFRSRASNFVTGTVLGNNNLYVKELASGRLALISRDADGAPANGHIINDHFTQIDADFSGRYVVFSSSFNHYLDDAAGITDNNQAQDVFLADLDPDGNGDYFDSAAHIYLLSAIADGSAAGNRASYEPTIAQDGGAVVWLTRAKDLTPALASNGAVVNVLLAQLGKRPDGSIDPSKRTLVAINHMGDDTETLTPQGARLARIDPWRDQVAFVTADDIGGSGDDHTGEDIYLSLRKADGVNERQLIWVTDAYSSSAPSTLNVAWDPLLPPNTLSQVAWVAQASPRTIDDLLIERAAPLYPDGWSTVNWVDATTPSTAAVTSSALSADGRFAFWTTSESYGFDVPPGFVNLFRRQIAPAQSASLTVHALGGTVNYAPAGLPLGGSTVFSATTLVNLTPKAGTGYRFDEWIGVDGREGMTATVIVYATRTVTASFEPMTPPIAHNLTVTSAEDLLLPGITLAISDPDPDESHTITLAQAPNHGSALVVDNMTSYQPAQNFHGQDHFTLQVTDAYGLHLTQAAQVTVQVMPINDAPIAAHALGSGVNNGGTIPVSVLVQDPDAGDSYTLTVMTPPSAGSVQIGSPLQTQTFAYTPLAEFAGVDSFTFRATDSANASITGTATVTVTRVPPASDNALLRLPALRRSP